MNANYNFLIWMIILSSIILSVVIWIIIVIFTKRLTQPIQVLTKLTEELKKATDYEGKKKVIQDAKNNEIFKNIHEQTQASENLLPELGLDNATVDPNAHLDPNRKKDISE